MTGEDILKAVREGKFHMSWHPLLSEHGGHKLRISVFRDAMKFDGVPAMTWNRKPVPEGHPDHGKVYDGVRLPATGPEMQQIADLLSCMLLTPKVVDLVWLEAGRTGVQFDSVVNVDGEIVANSDVHKINDEIEEALAKAGGDNGGIIDSVGKYWVICNALLSSKYSKIAVKDETGQTVYENHQACNYGWPTKGGGNGPGVLGTHNVWQRIGTQHDFNHYDPSQTIRLMYRTGLVQQAGSDTWRQIDLHEVAADPELAPLISHEGVLKTVRQPGVPEPVAVKEPDGSFTLPEVHIFGDRKEPLV